MKRFEYYDKDRGKITLVEMYTRKETAQLLGVTKQTVSNWIDTGKLDGCRWLGQIYIPKVVVDAILTSRADSAARIAEQFKGYTRD